MALRLTIAGVNRVMASGLLLEVSDAKLQIYSGTRPDSPESALELQTLLAVLTLRNFQLPQAGTLTTTEIESVSVQASGEARWGLLVAVDGTRIGDLSVGQKDRDPSADVTWDQTAFRAGDTLQLDRLTLALPTE
jgi:hypothetical protein